jgi:site-specific recombinase XerD
MALNLYRRHRPNCEGGRPYDSRSGEFDERKKTWRKCACPIFASGSLARRFRRQTTGKSEWDAARAIAAAWEQVGNWNSAVSTTPEPSLATVAHDGRMAILDATEAFLSKCKNRGIQPATFAKYQTFTRQLKAYAEHRGYVFLDQLTVGDMDRFYCLWKDGIRAKAKKLDRLKSFISFCLKREWLAKDITGDLQAPAGSSVTLPKAPFTDEELNRIFAACDAIGQPVPQGPGYRTWTGEDAKDFIYLSIYTGLRISDVATFDVAKRLHGNDVFLRMHKTRQPLTTWIPGWLVHRLKARQEKHGALIFRCGVSFTMKQLTDIWRNTRLAKVFEVAGPFEEKPTPHRFRHTFVRILLEKGVPVADVAELIGDTEDVLRRHYSRWIKTRQDRLTRILQDAFEDKPKPKLVTMPGGRG